ncbi:uncharacterized protein LOC129090444 [Anoplopoma fimbria]|uniref:uncharacterized protein LOC129090444 n=1 Tax=Anoplopoma fimbria TaxID=229290 RepID=UPI0023EB15CA|nr:uncharacterized protein LOC129090444 [Anoplopoma fimbria]
MATVDHCSDAACGTESREPGEEQGLGYMMMSSHGSQSSAVLPQDDYVTIASPQKDNRAAYSSSSSSLQTSFNSSTSESYSPLPPSHLQTHELSQPHWLVTSVQQSETEADQSQMRISCSGRPQDDASQEQTSAKHRRVEQTRASSSPVRSVYWSSMMTPFVTSGPDHTRPVQASPNSGKGRSSRAASDKSVRRYRLSLCLPSCLQAEDRC